LTGHQPKHPPPHVSSISTASRVPIYIALPRLSSPFFSPSGFQFPGSCPAGRFVFNFFYLTPTAVRSCGCPPFRPFDCAARPVPGGVAARLKAGDINAFFFPKLSGRHPSPFFFSPLRRRDPTLIPPLLYVLVSPFPGSSTLF